MAAKVQISRGRNPGRGKFQPMKVVRGQPKKRTFKKGDRDIKVDASFNTNKKGHTHMKWNGQGRTAIINMRGSH